MYLPYLPNLPGPTSTPTTPTWPVLHTYSPHLSIISGTQRFTLFFLTLSRSRLPQRGVFQVFSTSHTPPTAASRVSILPLHHNTLRPSAPFLSTSLLSHPRQHIITIPSCYKLGTFPLLIRPFGSLQLTTTTLPTALILHPFSRLRIASTCSLIRTTTRKNGWRS